MFAAMVGYIYIHKVLSNTYNIVFHVSFCSFKVNRLIIVKIILYTTLFPEIYYSTKVPYILIYIFINYILSNYTKNRSNKTLNLDQGRFGIYVL